MYFRMLLDEATGLASYLLADLDAAQAVLIDPRAADVPVLAAMLGEHRLRLRWVLRTHEHDAQLPLERPVVTTLGAPIVEHGTREAGRARLEVGAEHLHVLHTPGHTEGCLSFIWRDRLFCGGLLAADACPHQPRPALPEALWRSVTQTVFTLPAETLIFGGHSRGGHVVSTVLAQRRWHPWFGRASRDDFLSRLRQSAALLPEGIPS